MPARSPFHILSPTLCFVVLSLFFLQQPVHADTIILKDGSIMSGKIMFAHAQTVRMRVDTGNVDIAKEQIKSVTFSSADVIRLKSGEAIERKLLSENNDSLYVLTAGGMQAFASGAVEDTLFNLGHPFTINEMPATGPLFTNNGGAPIAAGDFLRNVFIRGAINLHFPRLGQWKNRLILGGGDLISMGLLYGIGIGYEFNRNVSAAIQYEAYSSEAEPFGNGTDKAMYRYVYGTFKYSLPISASKQTVLTAALDLGLLEGIDETDVEGYPSVQDSRFIVAPRISIGCTYYLAHENISLSSAAGYLFAKFHDNFNTGVGLPDATIDFSGPTLFVSVQYHFPLRKRTGD
jgi:hypothetical protein